MKAISDARSAEKKAQANARAKENRAYRKKIRDKQRGEEEIRTIEEDREKSRPRRRMDNNQPMPSKRQREMECFTLQRWDGWNQSGRGNRGLQRVSWIVVPMASTEEHQCCEDGTHIESPDWLSITVTNGNTGTVADTSMKAFLVTVAPAPTAIKTSLY